MTRIPFILLSTSDGSPLTGASPSVTISKDGAAFTVATNNPAEIGNGYYYIDLTTAETTVNNNVIIRATAIGAQPTAVVWEPEQDLSGLSTFDPSTDAVTINTTQAATLATAAALATVGDNVSAVKAKTDNLPQSPAAVGSAMTLTEATVTAIRNGLATITATDALAQGLDNLARYGDTYWSTADVSGLSTFDPSTDAVTLTDAYDAAKTASQFNASRDAVTIGEASETAIRYGLSTFNPATDAVTIDSEQASTFATATVQAAQTAALDKLDASILHWVATASTLTLYDNNGAAIGVYDLTRDSSGNITAIEPHAEG